MSIQFIKALSCRTLSSTNSSSLASPNLPFAIRSSCSCSSSSSLMLVSRCNEYNAPQRSDEWHSLRRDKLTTSTFSSAMGFWKGRERAKLWREKVFVTEAERMIEGGGKEASQWGLLKEEAAIAQYKAITGNAVRTLGFAVHSEGRFDWLGASPDGLLDCLPGGGVLEVKCPYNKGRPEMGQPWLTIPFYYMPQVQGQLEVMDREWADLYCWTVNGSTVFRVRRARDYWESIRGILSEFWWGNVIPAREAVLVGKKEKAKSCEPAPTHKLTRYAIFKSLKLASQSKLLCRESAGRVEFFQ